MPRLQVPYQCLSTCQNFLIAARGSSIDLFNLEDLSLLSTWKCPSNQTQRVNLQQSIPNLSSKSQHLASSEDTVPVSSSPPAKRRKLSGAGDNLQPAEKDGKNEKKDKIEKNDQNERKKANNRSDAVVSGLQAPAIIALAVTNGGQHVIAVTGEDKSIRVFEIVSQQDGRQQLRHISQRVMPKRPCALTVTDDGSTIIAADKFGDVYLLPLLVLKDEEGARVNPPTQKVNIGISKPFMPAANDLTVHSQRNLKALQNQMRQTNKAPEKSEPTFEHTLLLGHVSMLTDVVLAIQGDRRYIITADRDEHIRISRSIPQAHIIEGFCLGHTEFVSRVCSPKERPDLLISGGGDDDLFVWRWASGKLLSRVNLRDPIQSAMLEIDSKLERFRLDQWKVAVSGITHSRLPSGEDIVFVICEGIPVLLVFLLTTSENLDFIQSIRLEGNALSVAVHFSDRRSSLMISVDNIHALGSTTEQRTPELETVKPLQFYEFQGRLLKFVMGFGLVGDQEELGNGTSLGHIRNLLYSLENLRKRDGDARDDD